MASSLLKCSICPKQPTFSDESHLLTHVSSKGHLAHLHKLQVRSHQEISAGHQLAAYDQWYQQHGLGQLLSERMLQKEAKKACKHNRSRPVKKRVKNETTESSHIDPKLTNNVPPRAFRNSSTFNSQLHRSQTMPAPLKARPTPIPSEDESDYDSSPIKGFRRRQLVKTFGRLVKSPTPDGGVDFWDVDGAAEDDPEILTTPDSSKLKGIIWPGMDLFDAASAEMRRRRNQKKDGKTLKQMEITSRIVEPTEVIYSPSGAMRKQRLITGMVDDSSPLKGETPIPKKQIRRRRVPLAETDGNVPRYAPRPRKPTLPSMSSSFRDIQLLANQTLRHLSGPSAAASYNVPSHFSPSEDETMEFRLTVGHLHNSERAGNFTIFNDGDVKPQQRPMTASEQFEAAQPRLAQAENHTQSKYAMSLQPFLTTSWLQPQHQQTIPYNNPYTAYTQQPQGHTSYQGLGVAQERNAATIGHSTQVGEQVNPLGRRFMTGASDPHRASLGLGLSSYPGFNTFASQDDAFGYTSNPLSAAYQQLHGPHSGPFMMSANAQASFTMTNEKKRVPSPDGTISDQGGDDYTPGLFGPSE